MSAILDKALDLTQRRGLSVLPVANHDWTRPAKDKDGRPFQKSLRKVPAYMNGQGPKVLEWDPFKKRRMSVDECQTYFAKSENIGLIMGAVSGYAECVDFDEAGVYEEFREILVDNGHEELVDRLFVQSTLTPGHYQIIYRCPDGIEGGRHLAMRPATATELLDKPGQKAYVLIETRGEGNYAVVPPSVGYSAIQGSLEDLPTISGEERRLLWDAARYLDRMPAVDAEAPVRRETARATTGAAGLTPGDDFDLRGDWCDILEPHGWTIRRHKGRLTDWTRGGKDPREGGSASTGLGHHGVDLLKVFTTSGYPLENKTYGKFRAYAVLNFGGDLSAAAKDLYAKGFGDRVKPKDTGGQKPSASDELSGPSAVDESTTPKVRLFKRVLWSELRARPPKPMLVEGFLGAGDSMALVGKRKGGKSAVTFDLILRMLAGNEFANRFEIPRPLRVAYFTEEGTGSVHTRLDAANRDFGLPDRILEENLFYFENLPQLFDPQDEYHIDRLVEELLEDDARVDVTIHDTYVKSINGGDENSNSDSSVCLRALGRARKALGCASILIHHEGRNGNVRGASALDGDVDEMVWVDWDEESGERKMRYGFAKDLTAWEDVHLSLRTVDQDVPGSFAVEWEPSRRPSTARERILRAMRRDPGASWTVAQVKQETGLNADTTNRTLLRMADAGEVLRSKPDGAGTITYRLPGVENQDA